MNKIISILGIIIIFSAGFFILRNLDAPSNEPYVEERITNGTQIIMTLNDAREIANSSHCVKNGDLSGFHIYNPSTETYWFDLDIESEGCNPACVIDVHTRMATINWRCTGLINK